LSLVRRETADEQQGRRTSRRRAAIRRRGRFEQDRRDANIFEAELDEFVGVEVTVGNRGDRSPGEASQLTTAGIELGTDMWFPQIERPSRREVVVVSTRGSGRPRRWSATGEPVLAW